MEPTAKAIVKYHLQQRGWSQEELARRLGVTGGAVSMALNKQLLDPESRLASILEFLDLELVIRPRKS